MVYHSLLVKQPDLRQRLGEKRLLPQNSMIGEQATVDIDSNILRALPGTITSG